MALSTTDKLNILRTANIFVETPAKALSEVADCLSEVRLAAGETIFKKGDPGSAMYLIAEGRLRAHDGERFFNYLNKRDVFGEMAALDPEPRSASVTAEEDSLLLCLDRETLLQMMDRHPEIAQGVIQVLSRHLRARIRDMASDYEYLRQFARVTAAAVAVEAGVYEPESLDEVARRSDALGQLARVFQRMVREVYTREQRLRQQLAELRIEINEARQKRQVAEITETDYFQDLQKRAKDLRAAFDE
jgi:CRP-like cAMP-binding protein